MAARRPTEIEIVLGQAQKTEEAGVARRNFGGKCGNPDIRKLLGREPCPGHQQIYKI
jgi:hypothetical protein